MDNENESFSNKISEKNIFLIKLKEEIEGLRPYSI
jgi:hypothetical protein